MALSIWSKYPDSIQIGPPDPIHIVSGYYPDSFRILFGYYLDSIQHTLKYFRPVEERIKKFSTFCIQFHNTLSTLNTAMFFY